MSKHPYWRSATPTDCELWDESRAHREELKDHRGVALLLNKLGNCASAKGDYAAARSLHEESFKRFRELDDAWGVAVALDDLGISPRLLVPFADRATEQLEPRAIPARHTLR